MKPPRRSFSIVLLSLFILVLSAIQPLLTADLTCGYDNVFHLWRAVEVEHLLKQGVLFSRWAPDMAHGFGFPLFVFHAPGSAYVAALFHLAGISWSLAVNATFTLGIILGALFTFLLARDLFGPYAGVVAAVAYAYAPYQAYEMFNRGSLSEAFAWAFPPLVVWAIERWAVRVDRRFLAVGAVSLAALILTHQLFASLFTPLFIGWVLLAAYLARDVRIVLRGAALGLLGLGLSAFFWLPGLAERGWVQTERLLGTWVFEYQNNFLTVSNLLSPPRVADPSLVNDWPPKALGLLPVLVALLPLARWRRLDRATRGRVALLLALAVALGLMTLPVSLPLWNHLPLLPYVQFPWRFLGPAALCLALLSGAAAAPLTSSSASRLSLPAILIIPILILGNLGWFYPTHCLPPEETSVAGMIAWERQTDTLGTTAKGEYLPIWVQRMPECPALRAAYDGGTIPLRLNPADLPEGTRIVDAQVSALGATIELESATSFRARYLAFYYPGWRVWVDGEPVEVAPTDPDGLIAFGVPAGRHEVTIRFGETPLRLISDGISVFCLSLILLLLIRGPKNAQV